MKAAIRLTMLGLLMGIAPVQAWASPGAQRARDARPQQRAERSRPVPAQQHAVRGQRGDGSAGASSGVTGGNQHVPNKRVYAQRLQQEVAVHRSRMARLDQLDRIYSGKGMRARVSEVQMLRNREVRRFQVLLQRFRDALGPADFQLAAAALRIRGREAARNVPRQNPVQQRSRRSAPERQNDRKRITRQGEKEH